MNQTRHCPACQAEIPAESPAGLCPACLMKAGLESRSALDAVAATQSSPAGAAGGFIPPTPAELAARLPQLEILELLGRGGMGAVYKARQKGLDRLVAVKILPPEISRDPAFAERFTREARALAKLSHPNIVGVYDFGHTDVRNVGDSLYFIVMEYVDGVNLRQALKTGGISPDQALAIVPQVCEALQFAHDEGVVHRDIKPENILLDKRGRVKIADFGLAKMLGAEAADTALTGTHQVMGTIRYMAPEQLEGAPSIDHRADIYSLGVVFYELLTGELPLGRFAPPSKKVQIDVRLDEVVLRALEKSPEQRWQHASDVRTELATIVGPAGNVVHTIPAAMLGHEYRSKRTLFGVPLLHIAYGVDPKTGRKYHAKGIIALGEKATGVVAFGGTAYGGICFGGLAAGVISFGGLSLGLLAAVGGLAIGGIAWGGLAVGIVAMGGAALGGYMAFGGYGLGGHVLASNLQEPPAREFFEPWAYRWTAGITLLSIILPVLSVAVYGISYWFLRNQSQHDPRRSRGGSAMLDRAASVEQPIATATVPTYTRWVIVPLLMLATAWIAVSLVVQSKYSSAAGDYRPLEIMRTQLWGVLLLVVAVPTLLTIRWTRTLPAAVGKAFSRRVWISGAVAVVAALGTLAYMISPWNQPHVEAHGIEFRPRSKSFDKIALGVRFLSHLRTRAPYDKPDYCEVSIKLHDDANVLRGYLFVTIPGLKAEWRQSVVTPDGTSDISKHHAILRRDIFMDWLRNEARLPLDQPEVRIEADELWEMLNHWADECPQSWEMFVATAATKCAHFEKGDDLGERRYVEGRPSIVFLYIAAGIVVGFIATVTASAIAAKRICAR